MTSPLPPNRRTALKLGLGTGIGTLLGVGAVRGEDPTATSTPSTSAQQPLAPTDPSPLVDARFPCEIAEDVWIIPDRRIAATAY